MAEILINKKKFTQAKLKALKNQVQTANMTNLAWNVVLKKLKQNSLTDIN